MLFILRVFAVGLAFLCFPAGNVLAQQDSYDGLIEPSEIVDVGSQVSGILEEISVERGDRIEKGQVIARLKSDIEEAALELAKARVEFARRKVLRNEELYQKELISIHDKDEMETELRISELQLREAQARLEIRNIRSTIDGVVVERFLSPGEYVGEDPIMRIACLDPLYVEIIVSAEKFGIVKKGAKAVVSVDIPKPRRYRCSIIAVDRVIDAASGTFGIRLLLNNPDYLLPSGMKCRVNLGIN
jgi:membrane fusion protein (multidrug efflux system)